MVEEPSHVNKLIIIHLCKIGLRQARRQRGLRSYTLPFCFVFMSAAPTSPVSATSTYPPSSTPSRWVTTREFDQTTGVGRFFKSLLIIFLKKISLYFYFQVLVWLFGIRIQAWLVRLEITFENWMIIPESICLRIQSFIYPTWGDFQNFSVLI
jgi:hypothetical protein